MVSGVPPGALGLESLLRSQTWGQAARGALFYPPRRRDSQGTLPIGEASASQHRGTHPLLYSDHKSVLQGRHVLCGPQLKKNMTPVAVQLTSKFEFFKPLGLIYNYSHWRADLTRTSSPRREFSPSSLSCCCLVPAESPFTSLPPVFQDPAQKLRSAHFLRFATQARASFLSPASLKDSVGRLACYYHVMSSK